VQAREQANQRQEDDPGAHRGHDSLGFPLAAAEDRQAEDPQVTGDAGQIRIGPVRTLRPGQAEAGPDDEAGDESQRKPRLRGRAATGHGADQQRSQHGPAGHEAELVVDQRVVPAAFEAQVDHRSEAEQPGPDGAPVGPAREFQRRFAAPHRCCLHCVLCYEAASDGADALRSPSPAIDHMNPLRTSISLLLAAIAGFCLPAGAAAAIVPPGNSAATQYTEAFPTAGGPKATRDTRQAGKATPGQVLGARNAKELETRGSQGREAAELAAATAPASVAATLGASGAGDSREAPAGGKQGTAAANAPDSSTTTGTAAATALSEPQGSSGLGEVIGQATGSSSSGQPGLLLPLAIACVAVWAILFLARRRRQPVA
jgi:hypothetical protein